MKTAITAMKNTLQGINNGVDETKDQVNNFEDDDYKNTQSGEQKDESSVRILFKYNMHIMGVSGKEEEGIENLFEKIMTENSLNLVQGIDIQVQEVQKVPNKVNPRRPTLRCIIIKMPKVKDKERILKAAREKKLVMYKGVPGI